MRQATETELADYYAAVNAGESGVPGFTFDGVNLWEGETAPVLEIAKARATEGEPLDLSKARRGELESEAMRRGIDPGEYRTVSELRAVLVGDEAENSGDLAEPDTTPAV